MKRREFKVGDKVRGTKDCNNDLTGGEGVIERFNSEKTRMYIRITKASTYYGVGQLANYWVDRYVERRTGKSVLEDLTRYMVYGQGCDNKGDLLETEKDMKEELKELIQDDDWKGRIIGYKLVPIFEAETKVVLRSLDKSPRGRLPKSMKTIKPVKAKKK